MSRNDSYVINYVETLEGQQQRRKENEEIRAISYVLGKDDKFRKFHRYGKGGRKEWCLSSKDGDLEKRITPWFINSENIGEIFVGEKMLLVIGETDEGVKLYAVTPKEAPTVIPTDEYTPVRFGKSLEGKPILYVTGREQEGKIILNIDGTLEEIKTSKKTDPVIIESGRVSIEDYGDFVLSNNLLRVCAESGLADACSKYIEIRVEVDGEEYIFLGIRDGKDYRCHDRIVDTRTGEVWSVPCDEFGNIDTDYLKAEIGRRKKETQAKIKGNLLGLLKSKLMHKGKKSTVPFNGIPFDYYDITDDRGCVKETVLESSFNLDLVLQEDISISQLMPGRESFAVPIDVSKDDEDPGLVRFAYTEEAEGMEIRVAGCVGRDSIFDIDSDKHGYIHPDAALKEKCQISVFRRRHEAIAQELLSSAVSEDHEIISQCVNLGFVSQNIKLTQEAERLRMQGEPKTKAIGTHK